MHPKQMSDIEVAKKLDDLICNIEAAQDAATEFMWDGGMLTDKIHSRVALDTAKEQLSYLQLKIGRETIDRTKK